MTIDDDDIYMEFEVKGDRVLAVVGREMDQAVRIFSVGDLTDYKYIVSIDEKVITQLREAGAEATFQFGLTGLIANLIESGIDLDT